MFTLYLLCCILSLPLALLPLLIPLSLAHMLVPIKHIRAAVTSLLEEEEEEMECVHVRTGGELATELEAEEI